MRNALDIYAPSFARRSLLEEIDYEFLGREFERKIVRSNPKGFSTLAAHNAGLTWEDVRAALNASTAY